jgi:hypothetical protein
MLRVESILTHRFVPIYKKLDLRTLVADAGKGAHTLQIEASFWRTRLGSEKRIGIRAFAFEETPDTVNTWSAEMRDAALIAVGSPKPQEGSQGGWERVMLKIEVPENARTLVLVLQYQTKAGETETLIGYIDDLKVSLIQSGPPKKGARTFPGL